MNEYLKNRGINQEVIEKFGIMEEKEYIKIPYYDQNRKFLFNKCRSKISKEFWYEPKGKKLQLYNLWNLKTYKDYVVICEGEIDCLTLVQFGINAVGCPGANIFKKEWASLFDHVEKVITGFDNDIQGIEGARKIAEDKIIYRDIFNILIPRENGAKDLNDLLIKSNYKKEDFLNLVQGCIKYEMVMNEYKNKKTRNKKTKNKDEIKVNRFVFDDFIGEIVYSKKEQEGGFLVFNKETGEIKEENEFSYNGKIFLPDIESELIQKKVIRIPEGISDYGSTKELLSSMHLYLNKYVDLENEVDRDIVLTYVLLSWVYDRFSSIPYLRALGDYGCGKSRLLQILNICYKSIYASGNASEAPIFRLIDKYGGTLIIDEAEFGRNTDKSAGIKEILRFGKDRGGVVLRCNRINNKVETFNAFGPKILGARRTYNDDALESRIIDIKMKETKRDAIPLNLDIEEFEYDSKELRKKLLKWSFENFFKIDINIYKKYIDGSIIKRVNEMISPLICIRSWDLDFINKFKEKAYEKNKDLLDDKSLSLEAKIIEEIYISYSRNGEYPLLKNIIDNLNLENGKKYSSRSIASIIRNNLQMKMNHTRNGNTIEINKKRLDELIDQYNLKSFSENSDDVTDVTKMEKTNINPNRFI